MSYNIQYDKQQQQLRITNYTEYYGVGTVIDIDSHSLRAIITNLLEELDE